MFAIAGILPGLHHDLLHGGSPADGLRARAELVRILSGLSRSGTLLMGAWGLTEDCELAVRVSLELAASGASVALCSAPGAEGEPPLCAGMLWASEAAGSVRAGEIAVPATLAATLSLPVGVARQAAPGQLGEALGALDLIRDYRGP